MLIIIWLKIPQMPQNFSAQNTPNAPKFISPICLPKPKSWISLKKKLHWTSVVLVCKSLLMRCAKFNNGIFTTVARLGPSNPTLWYHFEKSRKYFNYLSTTYLHTRKACNSQKVKRLVFCYQNCSDLL